MKLLFRNLNFDSYVSYFTSICEMITTLKVYDNYFNKLLSLFLTKKFIIPTK